MRRTCQDLAAARSLADYARCSVWRRTTTVHSTQYSVLSTQYSSAVVKHQRQNGRSREPVAQRSVSSMSGVSNVHAAGTVAMAKSTRTRMCGSQSSPSLPAHPGRPCTTCVAQRTQPIAGVRARHKRFTGFRAGPADLLHRMRCTSMTLRVDSWAEGKMYRLEKHFRALPARAVWCVGTSEGCWLYRSTGRSQRKGRLRIAEVLLLCPTLASSVKTHDPKPD